MEPAFFPKGAQGRLVPSLAISEVQYSGLLMFRRGSMFMLFGVRSALLMSFLAFRRSRRDRISS